MNRGRVVLRTSRRYIGPHSRRHHQGHSKDHPRCHSRREPDTFLRGRAGRRRTHKGSVHRSTGYRMLRKERRFPPSSRAQNGRYLRCNIHRRLPHMGLWVPCKRHQDMRGQGRIRSKPHIRPQPARRIVIPRRRIPGSSPRSSCRSPRPVGRNTHCRDRSSGPGRSARQGSSLHATLRTELGFHLPGQRLHLGVRPVHLRA